MTEQEALAYIETYTWSTTRLGLSRTRELLRAMGDPQKKLKFVHVAGSNGKGSVCAMLERILRAAGYRTGLYISPHLQDFRERMQVNGQMISPSELARITAQVRVFADRMADHPSQFELVTAIAMQYFAEQNCDLTVLEVGMGGALDSTNVIDCPEVAVITNIGLEHTEYLGSTLEEIAEAKGGIVKPGCTAVCYDSSPEAVQTLQKICRERQAEFRLSQGQDLQGLFRSLDGQRFRWKGTEYALSLLGAHQLRNAGTVLETVDVLRARGWKIPEEAVRQGLQEVHWPARFEPLWRDPLFLLDGGHNPQCAEALARTLADCLPEQKFLFLVGILADKDYRRVLELIAPFAEAFYCVTPDSSRALQATELAGVISEMGFPAQAFDSIDAGVRAALEAEVPVVAFGSLYLAGHVRTVFPKFKKKQQRREVLKRRDSLSPDKRSADSRALCEKLLALEDYQDAGTVFLWRAFGSEPDLSFFAEQAERDGKTLLYPCCTDRRHMLAVRAGEEWAPDCYGILSPVPGASSVCAPEEIDLVLCPCAGFDSEGRRLGMGAGFYDQFLPQCRKAVRVLPAFEAQRLDRVCTEANDLPIDIVITEAGITRIPRRD